MSIANKVRRLGLIASRQPGKFPAFVAQRLTSKFRSDRAKRGSGYVSHYGAWHGNAGDVMIVYAQHALIDSYYGNQVWVDENHKKKVEAADVARINKDAKVIMVGGGGLLLPDRHRAIPNTDSDWLWNVSLDNLAAYERPMMGFAIGYNRMKGQDEFRPYFKDHIAATVEKSVFFGMRNTSSLEKLSSYLPSRVADQLTLQPCPTNLMSIVRPKTWAAKRDPNRKAVVFVLFMGFKKLGIVEDHAKILRIAKQAKRMQKDGWEIHIATHTIEELAALPAFREAGVRFKHRMLDMMSREDIVQYYRDKTLVIGMRGHGVMLPYGIGVPVMGIINHVKVRYFLEEVQLGDQTVDLDDPHLEDRVQEMVTSFDANRPAMYKRIDDQKQRLWATTQANLDKLAPYFG